MLKTLIQECYTVALMNSIREGNGSSLMMLQVQYQKFKLEDRRKKFKLEDIRQPEKS